MRRYERHDETRRVMRRQILHSHVQPTRVMLRRFRVTPLQSHVRERLIVIHSRRH
jgi:hypothetical protein